MKRSNAIRRAPVFFLTLGALAVAPQLAQAQRRPRPQQAPPAEDPRVVEARRAYDDGRRLFDARSYVEALRRFERAFELRNTPVILVAIANCHEQTGNFRDAVAALERYLRDRADAPDRAQIEQRLTQLRPRAAQQTTATTTTATSTGASAGTTSAAASGSGAATSSTTGASSTTTTAGATGTAAGASARDAGTSAATSGAAAAGATSSAAEPAGNAGAAQQAATGADSASGASAATAANSAETGGDASASAAAEPVAPPPARGISPAVWVCAGLAAAGVAGGSVLGFLALGDHATYNTAPTRELKDRGETYALLADLSFATAVLSGFVGTVVFLSDRAEAEREQRASQALRPHERSRRASAPRVLPAPTGLTVHF